MKTWPKSYYIKMRARSGTLVGGGISTQSSRFESRRDAVDWAINVRDLNREAKRDVDPDYEVVASELKPEISRPDYYRKGEKGCTDLGEAIGRIF